MFCSSFVYCFHTAEYSTYANIEISRNGFRHLILNNYTFGESKVSKTMNWWRCTSNIRSGDAKTRRRCPVVLSTLNINGHEMIRHTNVHHTHPPKLPTRPTPMQ